MIAVEGIDGADARILDTESPRKHGERLDALRDIATALGVVAEANRVLEVQEVEGLFRGHSYRPAAASFSRSRAAASDTPARAFASSIGIR